MIVAVLLVTLGGVWVILPRTAEGNQTFVVNLIFSLGALGVIVQGVTGAYTARQARLRKQAEAEIAGQWPGASEEDDAAPAPGAVRIGGDGA